MFVETKLNESWIERLATMSKVNVRHEAFLGIKELTGQLPNYSVNEHEVCGRIGGV